MTPNGSGDGSGSDFSNALAKGSLSSTLNTTMVAGDTLYIGSGNYTNTRIYINSDGTASLPKSIIGVDTGGGRPHFNGDPDWTRSNPDAGMDHGLYIIGDHWLVENLEISRVRHGIKSSSSSSNASNYITLRDLFVHDVRHGMYVYYMDNSRFENVVIQEYTKQGFRLDRGCNNVTFTNCVADMTGGDESWWDYGEKFPFGFVSYGNGSSNSNLVFEDCVALNHRMNGQTDSDGNPLSYYNGDGFVLEDNNNGTTQFIRCISVNNEDGGYDLKSAANLEGCVSVKNYRGFRLWHTAKTLNNCVAAFPFRRTSSNEVGSEPSGGSGIWTQNGHSTVNNYTYYGNNGRGLDEDGSGSLTVSNSIIAFSGASGSFKTGTVTFDASTVQYRPGSGTDPLLISPSIDWNGIGDELDSETFGHSKGYHSLSTPYEAESLVVTNSGEGSVEVTNASAGGGELIRFDADGIGDYIEFNVPNLPAGTYSVYVMDKTSSDLGTYQLSVDGVDVGAPVDQYSASDAYGEVSIGDVTLAADTSAAFRFTVTGKNASSSGFKLSVDTIRLSLVGAVVEEESEFYDVLPEADTFVNDGNPNTNFGSDTRLIVKDASPDYDRIAYLRFAIPGEVTELVGAKLKLYVQSIGGEGSGARNIEIRQLANDAWNESTMTWNTREASNGTLITTIDARTVDEVHEIDVSAYVDQELAGDGTVSFVLIQPANDNRMVIFGSRENVGKEPILELETPVATSVISNIISEADTYVRDGAATTNYGGDSGMAVKDASSEYNRIAYVRFPLTSISGSVLNAKLKLRVKSIGGEGPGARYIEIRQLADDAWDEMTMTWNTRASSTGTIIETIDARTVGEVHEIDVSAYVAQEAASDGYVSFALKQPDNVVMYVVFNTREDTGYEPTLEVETTSGALGSMVFNSAGFSDYSTQSGSGSMTLGSGDTSIQLTGNYWRRYAFPYTVTANTVVEVTVDASDAGELTCIGFDSDNDYSTGLSHVKLAGSQVMNESFAPISPLYTAGSGPETLVIPVGSYFTGSMTHMTFVGDDDADSSINVTFSGIKVYESQ
ncbi:DUF7594 domain-containing protein [Cerasicoccus fimbriatus]|uniref:CBM96 family carbohydrate-binding protein n=1 Tax=Cerasicoccus fimbriatus TaxID=3014554 RepID=UPI0022B3FBA9|nr:DNRLRE domain-containing protein [Cerasicoccus sp. TK19100]